jgi:hypothetical protein
MFSRTLQAALLVSAMIAGPAAAQVVTESGDAGETLATAQVISGPVSKITGTLENLGGATPEAFVPDIDLYRISIVNPAAFGVTVETSLGTLPGLMDYEDDTMLFLFDLAGVQIRYIDDVFGPPYDLDPAFFPGEFASLTPGDYYLGFDLFGTHSVLNAGVLDGWTRQSAYEFGSYTLNITGAGGGQALPEPIGGGVPEPTTWALMILGFGAAGAALRRRAVLA